MATIYLRSTDGDDASDGSTWALAKATLAAALTAAGAGGTVYVSASHAESQASSMTLTSPGTVTAPVRVLCVDDTGNPEPPTTLASTASVATTGATILGLGAGVTYVYGLHFIAASGFNSATFQITGTTSSWRWIIDTCILEAGSTGGVGMVLGDFGSNRRDQEVVLKNTILKFNSSAQYATVRGRLVWNGGSVDSGTVPNLLFNYTNPNEQSVEIRGVDLSALGSGKTLVGLGNADDSYFRLQNCKLGSSVAIATGSWNSPVGAVEVVNCDSADTNYRYYKSTYQGEIFHESTIVRTGGASDGTTPISRKMVSTANTQFFSPLELGPLAVWNETVGSSVTSTVEVVTDGVTLTDAEAWLEVEYLGTSGYPLNLFGSDRTADILATPANQTASSETWTTTGLTSPVKQKLSVSFTPQEKGPIKFRVMLAKASTTLYVCPKVDFS